MTVYRMFATEDNHRSCVRIFKPEQVATVKPLLRKYCAESAAGTLVELIQYTNGKPVKCVYKVQKKFA